MKSFLLTAAIVIVIGLIVVANIHHPSPVLANDKTEPIRQIEAAMMQAGIDHGTQGLMSYYADNAVELSDNSPAVVGKANIAKQMSFLDDKQNRLTWTPAFADISDSGDLAYTYGKYEFRVTGKDGKSSTAYGNYTTIWKRQADGQWKVVLDTANSGPLPAS